MGYNWLSRSALFSNFPVIGFTLVNDDHIYKFPKSTNENFKLILGYK